jgi:hypothetical protein
MTIVIHYTNKSLQSRHHRQPWRHATKSPSKKKPGPRCLLIKELTDLVEAAEVPSLRIWESGTGECDKQCLKFKKKALYYETLNHRRNSQL